VRTTAGTVTSADGTRIAFRGQGDGPPLLIVPGTLAPADLYRPLADLLGERYQVVLMDRRNYGASEAAAGPATFARQAEDVAAVLDVLAAPAVVFAHSFGGLAALHALSIAGPQVSRLALYEAPVTLAGPPLAPVLGTCRDLVRAGRAADAVSHFLAAASDPPPGPDAERELRPLGAILEHLASGLLADLECMTSMDPDISRWSAIGTPALLLSGAHSDRVDRESTRILGGVLPDVRTVILPGLAHQPDPPAPVAEALFGFLGPGR
jgi:pimeloyl-ACP methyl ester carboxylesterase